MAKRFRKKNQYPTVRDGQSGFERAVPEVWILKMAYKRHSELADNFYNSVTVCFCASRKYVFHIGLKWEPNLFNMD